MDVKLFRQDGRGQVLTALFFAAILAGCSDDDPLRSIPTGEGGGEGLAVQDAVDAFPAPPPGQVTVALAGADLTLWPYTATNFSGEGSDPVDLIFTGQAAPVRIRAALLALDGDRTAFGFPNVYPFNATWSDAYGDVQVTYAGANGWTGGAVQLQLGAYEPVRWHLRLFETGDPYGPGELTVGAAHFEVMIPGTADHQVLSWEKAEEMVMVDLLRTGLLDPAAPYAQTEIINATPSFREIPAMIYNGLPEDLKFYIGGPAGQVSGPVPILTDGRATVLNMAVAQPIEAGTWTQDLTLTYEMVMPKPICNPAGEAWVLLTGPVEFHKTVTVAANGRFEFDGTYEGELTVTPWDLATMQPAGEPYPADVGGDQSGQITGARIWVKAHDERIARQADATELLMTWLAASNPGRTNFRMKSRCLE